MAQSVIRHGETGVFPVDFGMDADLRGRLARHGLPAVPDRVLQAFAHGAREQASVAVDRREVVAESREAGLDALLGGEGRHLVPGAAHEGLQGHAVLELDRHGAEEVDQVRELREAPGDVGTSTEEVPGECRRQAVDVGEASQQALDRVDQVLAKEADETLGELLGGFARLSAGEDEREIGTGGAGGELAGESLGLRAARIEFEPDRLRKARLSERAIAKQRLDLGVAGESVQVRPEPLAGGGIGVAHQPRDREDHDRITDRIKQGVGCRPGAGRRPCRRGNRCHRLGAFPRIGARPPMDGASTGLTAGDGGS